MRFDVVLNNLAGLAWTTRKIKLTSNGSPWRPLVHVLDICEAVACVLEAPRDAVHNQIINVGDTTQNYRVREIAEIVSKAFPGCPLTLGTDDKDNRSYRVSFEKIKSILPAFKCRRDASAGATQFRELFQRIQMSPEQFEFRAFTRLKQIQHLIANWTARPPPFLVLKFQNPHKSGPSFLCCNGSCRSRADSKESHPSFRSICPPDSEYQAALVNFAQNSRRRELENSHACSVQAFANRKGVKR